MNQRGWTWEESDEGSSHDEALVPLIEKLVAQWNQLNNEDEQARFRRQAMDDCGVEFEGPDFDTVEEEVAYGKYLAMVARQRAMRYQLIELQLRHMGARIMREYEHWNEEEHIREWMERDREGE